MQKIAAEFEENIQIDQSMQIYPPSPTQEECAASVIPFSETLTELSCDNMVPRADVIDAAACMSTCCQDSLCLAWVWSGECLMSQTPGSCE